MRLALRWFPIVLVGVAAALYSLVRAQHLRPGDPESSARHAAAASAAAENHRPGLSATCSRPLPESALSAAVARRVVPAGGLDVADLGALFAHWETVSADFEPVGRHERRRLLAQHHPGRSAHELDLICELRGPINAESLRERYTWESPVADAAHIRLTAETLDAVERLFFRRFTVTLDRETCRPVSVQFTATAGQGSSLPFPLETSLSLEARLARAVRDPQPSEGAVVPVGHDTDRVPPAPNVLPSPGAQIRPLAP